VQERCTKMVRDACALRNGNGLPPARRKAPHPRGRPGIIPVHFLVCSVKQMWKKVVEARRRPEACPTRQRLRPVQD
jgi:hypothetical protein